MHIVIIGAGVAGTAVLGQMLRLHPTQVTIISDCDPGCSPAFSGAAKEHLANTTTSTMSLDPAKPDDFTQWVHRNRPAMGSGFVPRRAFGDYLSEHYRTNVETLRRDGVTVETICDRAEHLWQKDDRRVTVALTSGRSLEYDHAVVCTGPGASRGIPGISPQFAAERGVFTNPYSAKLPTRLQEATDPRVLVIGSKLTAIDVAKTCLRKRASVVLASRSGHLPSVRTDLTLQWPPHLPEQAFTEYDAYSRFASASENVGTLIKHILQVANPSATHHRPEWPLQQLRRDVREAEAGDIEWQYVVGPFVEYANLLWPTLPSHLSHALARASARQFGRYISAIPLESAREINAAAGANRFAVRRSPASITPQGTQWRATWESGATESFDFLISATGQHSSAWSFAQDKLTIGQVGSPPPEVGVELNVKMGASTVSRVWAIGAITASRFPVVNYVRTIAVQAERVVRHIGATGHPSISHPLSRAPQSTVKVQV